MLTLNEDEIIKTTYYTRDAQGNVLATYTREYSNPNGTVGDLVLDEVPIYGSSRLGEWKPNLEIGLLSKINATFALSRGEKAYELSNHLGNVLAVVSDNGELCRKLCKLSIFYATIISIFIRSR